MNAAVVTQAELPRLHARRSNGERGKQKPESRRTSVVSCTANSATPNYCGTIRVDTNNDCGLGIIHHCPSFGRDDTAEEVSVRPRSTPGILRSPMYAHYRSDSPVAAARRPTTSEPTARHTQSTEQKHQDKDHSQALLMLQDENSSLRDNIRQLHAKLLEMMRGTNKVVGGGQFRVIASVPANASTTKGSSHLLDQPGCSKCSSLRHESARLKHELRRLVDGNEELKRYVEAVEQRQSAWHTERDTQRQEIEQLLRDVSEGNQARAIAWADRDQLEQQLLALQGKLECAQTELTEAMRAREIECVTMMATEAAEVQDASIQTSPTNEISREFLEAEARKRQQEREEIALQLEELQLATKTAQERLAIEQARSQSVEMEGRMRVDALQLHVGDQQKCIKDLNGEIAALNQRNQHLVNELAVKDQASIECERNSIKVIEQMEIAHRSKLANIQRIHDDAADTFKAANAGLERRINKLEAEKMGATDHIRRLTDQVARLSEQVRAHQENAEQSAVTASDIIDPEEMTQLKDQLQLLESTLQSTHVALNETRDQVEYLQAEMEERDEIIARIRDSHGRTLERALDKTLRICMVAPTVNVHLRTSMMSGPSQTENDTETEVIQCRSPPPHDAVQAIVEKEILPFYSRIVIGSDADSHSRLGTDATGDELITVPMQSGVPTDEWLEKLLDSMKQQLAKRIESVYSSMAS